MKKKYLSILTGIVLVLALTLLSSLDMQKGDEIPEDVEKIISNSCFGCHTTGARSEDAIKALDFKKWAELKPSKKVGALNEIKEVIEEGTMPPEKMLKKNPDKALSEGDKETILEWAKKETAKLME